MTSVLRIRRRHRLPEGNLGSSKPSYDEKAGAGNFPLLGDFRNGLSTNVAPVITTPIAPFTVFAGPPARSIDLTTAFSDPDASNAVQLGVSLPSSTASSLLRSTGSTNQSRSANFLNYVNFGRYFATDATSCKAADLSARSIRPNPPSLSPFQWEITVPLSGELGQCLPGSPSSRFIRNRSVTLLRQPAQFGRSCGDRGWRRRPVPHQYPVATSARPPFPV